MREGRGGVLYASKLQNSTAVFLDQGGLCLFTKLHRLPVLSVLSKTALLEGLEVDQYMWGILNAIQKYA